MYLINLHRKKWLACMIFMRVPFYKKIVRKSCENQMKSFSGDVCMTFAWILYNYMFFHAIRNMCQIHINFCEIYMKIAYVFHIKIKLWQINPWHFNILSYTCWHYSTYFLKNKKKVIKFDIRVIKQFLHVTVLYMIAAGV